MTPGGVKRVPAKYSQTLEQDIRANEKQLHEELAKKKAQIKKLQEHIVDLHTASDE